MCERTHAGSGAIRPPPMTCSENCRRRRRSCPDERRLLGVGSRPVRATMSSAWIEARFPTSRCDRLAQRLGRGIAGRDQQRVARLEAQVLAPLLVDHRVDGGLDLRGVVADVDLGSVVGAAEPDEVVLVLRHLPAQLGRQRQLTARDPVPDLLGVGTAAGVNRRYVAGSTAATVSAWFSITGWPIENRLGGPDALEVLDPPRPPRSSGCSGLKTSRSADARGPCVSRAGRRRARGQGDGRRGWAGGTAVGRGRRRLGLGVASPCRHSRPRRPAPSRLRPGAAAVSLPPGQGRWRQVAAPLLTAIVAMPSRQVADPSALPRHALRGRRRGRAPRCRARSRPRSPPPTPSAAAPLHGRRPGASRRTPRTPRPTARCTVADAVRRELVAQRGRSPHRPGRRRWRSPPPASPATGRT